MTYWKEWAKAAGIRAIRTAAEAMLAYIGTGALVLGDVNWIAALSAGAMGAVTAVLLALTGLPEVKLNKVAPPEAWREDRADAVAPDDAEYAEGVSRKKSGEDGFRPEG